MNLSKRIIVLSAGVSVLATGYSCQKQEVEQPATAKVSHTSDNNQQTRLVINATFKPLEETASADELRAIGWTGGAQPTIDKTNFVNNLFSEGNSTARIIIRHATANTSTYGNYYKREFNVGLNLTKAGNSVVSPITINSDGTIKFYVQAADWTFFPTAEGNSYAIVAFNGEQGDPAPSISTNPDGTSASTDGANVDGRPYQDLYFYSKVQNTGSKNTRDVSPNKIVKEVTDGAIDYRTYPYMSSFAKVDTRNDDAVATNANSKTTAGKTTGRDNYSNEYEYAGNYGIVGLTFEPRGCLFRFKLSNKTGKEITVNSILGDNTTARVLGYQGYFNLGGNTLPDDGTSYTYGNPILQANLAQGVKPIFTEYYGATWATETASTVSGGTTELKGILNEFPLYQSDGTTAGYTLSAGGESTGYFYVWGYPLTGRNEATTQAAAPRARFRVKYTESGASTTTNSMIVKIVPTAYTNTSGQTLYGFAEGKVYTATLEIK